VPASCWPEVCGGGRNIVTHQEWLPTLLAAAGEPDIVEKLKQGHQAGETTFHVHIDGFNILPYLTGETDKYPRNFFFYVNDDGQLTAIRVGDWKVVYMEQRAKTMQLWAEPFVDLRMPKIFNLRRDPFERADENSNGYWNWVLSHIFVLYGALVPLKQQLETFGEFPQRQKPGAFNLDQLIERTLEVIHSSHR
jgi:arylsulfatase